MRFKGSGFAGLLIAAALCVSSASADQIYFTASGTGSLNYSSWNIPNGIFGFYYDYLDVEVSCPGGSCLAASTPDGTPLGDFGFGVGGNYFVSNAGNGQPAYLIDTSLYYQELVPFPAGGSGSIALDSATLGPYLLQGTVTGIGIYGAASTTSATIEFDITNATSQVISGLPSTVYLDVSGTTSTAIGVTAFSGNPPGLIINAFDLDWTATLSDTSLLNSTSSPSSPSSAPEPSTLLLVAGGIVGLAARRVRFHPLR